MSFQLSVV